LGNWLVRILIVAVLAASTIVLMSSCHLGPAEYALPVTLGSSSNDIRRALGSPKESFKDPRDNRLTIEWYYTHGIVATFERDRLVSIGLPPDHGRGTTYDGFLAYSGEIIRGVRLTDTKQGILKKLGKPTKIETDDLPPGTDPAVPVVWPKESRYYWRLANYTVRVDFLSQAQSVSVEHKLILPKDSLTMIRIEQ
jgi:hypothetical protein